MKNIIYSKIHTLDDIKQSYYFLDSFIFNHTINFLKKSIKFVFFTHNEFKHLTQQLQKKYQNINIYFKFVPHYKNKLIQLVHTKYNICSHFETYQNIIYCDLSVIILNIKSIIDKCTEQLLVIEEDSIQLKKYSEYQPLTDIYMDIDQLGFNHQCFTFKNSPKCQSLFNKIKRILELHVINKKPIPQSLDQSFLVYNAIQDNVVCKDPISLQIMKSNVIISTSIHDSIEMLINRFKQSKYYRLDQKSKVKRVHDTSNGIKINDEFHRFKNLRHNVIETVDQKHIIYASFHDMFLLSLRETPTVIYSTLESNYDLYDFNVFVSLLCNICQLQSQNIRILFLINKNLKNLISLPNINKQNIIIECKFVTMDTNALLQKKIKYMIFDYISNDNNQKIIYLHHTMFIHNLKQLLLLKLKQDKLHVLKHDNLSNIFYHQYQPFQSHEIDTTKSSFLDGFFMFKFSDIIREVFNIVKRNIDLHVSNGRMKPYGLDHPFLVYHILHNQLEDFDLLHTLYSINKIKIEKNIVIHAIMNKTIRSNYIIKQLLMHPNIVKKIYQNHHSVTSPLIHQKFYCDKNYIEIKDNHHIIFNGIEHPYRVHHLYPILMTSKQNIIIYHNHVMSCFGEKMVFYRFKKHNIDVFRIQNSFFLKKMSLFWQYPVLTEKEFYDQNKSNPSYFPFPWATMIDKGYHPNDIYNVLTRMFQFNKPLFTCCQHIHFRTLKQLWIDLGIVLVYTSHKVIKEDYLGNIRLAPCPLYAINIEDKKRNQIFKNKDFVNLKRKYLYSFMGGYQPIHYLTSIRQHIFKLKGRHKNSLIINTGDWHFNCDVYGGKQNVKGELNENKTHKDKTQFYNTTLLQSRYTLTPSGSGPNSIRFWEALAVGSIPVLLADTLELPKHPLWNVSILRIPEKLIYNIESILKSISVEEEIKRRQNCITIYNDFRNHYRGGFNRNMKQLSHVTIKPFVHNSFNSQNPIYSIYTQFRGKNDILFLEEWIVYHIMMGFSRFFLYDISILNDTSFSKYVQLNSQQIQLIKDNITNKYGKHRIQWIQLDKLHSDQESIHRQHQSFSKRDNSWNVFVNQNEFIVIPKYKTIQSFIKTIRSNVNTIFISKLYFSSRCNHVQTLVTEIDQMFIGHFDRQKTCLYNRQSSVIFKNHQWIGKKDNEKNCMIKTIHVNQYNTRCIGDMFGKLPFISMVQQHKTINLIPQTTRDQLKQKQKTFIISNKKHFISNQNPIKKVIMICLSKENIKKIKEHVQYLNFLMLNHVVITNKEWISQFNNIHCVPLSSLFSQSDYLSQMKSLDIVEQYMKKTNSVQCLYVNHNVFLFDTGELCFIDPTKLNIADFTLENDKIPFVFIPNHQHVMFKMLIKEQNQNKNPLIVWIKKNKKKCNVIQEQYFVIQKNNPHFKNVQWLTLPDLKGDMKYYKPYQFIKNKKVYKPIFKMMLSSNKNTFNYFSDISISSRLDRGIDIVIPLLNQNHIYCIQKTWSYNYKQFCYSRQIYFIVGDNIRLPKLITDNKDIVYKEVQIKDLAIHKSLIVSSNDNPVYWQMLSLYIVAYCLDTLNQVFIINPDIQLHTCIYIDDTNHNKDNLKFCQLVERLYHTNHIEEHQNIYPFMKKINKHLSNLEKMCCVHKNILKQFIQKIEKHHKLPFMQYIHQSIKTNNHSINLFDIYLNYTLQYHISNVNIKHVTTNDYTQIKIQTN